MLQIVFLLSLKALKDYICILLEELLFAHSAVCQMGKGVPISFEDEDGTGVCLFFSKKDELWRRAYLLWRILMMNLHHLYINILLFEFFIRFYISLSHRFTMLQTISKFVIEYFCLEGYLLRFELFSVNHYSSFAAEHLLRD